VEGKKLLFLKVAIFGKRDSVWTMLPFFFLYVAKICGLRKLKTFERRLINWIVELKNKLYPNFRGSSKKPNLAC
jgi:hypothetical protein